MFGSLLERPLVAPHGLDQYPRLVAMFDQELDVCRLIFDGQVQASELGEAPVKLFTSCSTLLDGLGGGCHPRVPGGRGGGGSPVLCV